MFILVNGDKPKRKGNNIMATSKKYTLIKSRNGRDRTIEGTVVELTEYFSYTLEVGHSYNRKILTQPKTIKSLVSNISKALDEKEGVRRTSVRQVA